MLDMRSFDERVRSSGSRKRNASSFKVVFNNEVIKDGQGKVIHVTSPTVPEIVEMSSWDYTKKKIEAKIKAKGGNISRQPKI